MPLYGSVLWDFESKETVKFYTEWRKAIRRLFNLSNRTHCRYLHLICNDLPVKVQLYKRFNKFIATVINSYKLVEWLFVEVNPMLVKILGLL